MLGLVVYGDALGSLCVCVCVCVLCACCAVLLFTGLCLFFFSFLSLKKILLSQSFFLSLFFLTPVSFNSFPLPNVYDNNEGGGFEKISDFQIREDSTDFLGFFFNVFLPPSPLAFYFI